MRVKGQRFGRLTILSEEAKNLSDKVSCICDCGTKKLVVYNHMRRNLTKSCGCYHAERIGNAKRTHGLSRTPEYRAWLMILHRCKNPKCVAYRSYGARGIGVCDEWATSFEAFLGYVGQRPSKSHSIGRINNNAGYHPGNVRWETRSQQMRNMRGNRIIVVNGTRMTLVEASERLGVSENCIRERLRRGWTEQEAATTPQLQ